MDQQGTQLSISSAFPLTERTNGPKLETTQVSKKNYLLELP